MNTRHQPLSHHFTTMAWNNAWANQRLLKACLQLSDAEFQAPRVSFFPTIAHTLNHNLTVDWYYVDAMQAWRAGRAPEREPVKRFYTPEQPFARCADLAKAQREVDMRLVKFCESLRDEELEQGVKIQRRVGVLQETVTRLLAHVFEHQIHHRGQAHAMLAGSHVSPPQLDEFFCEQDSQGIAPELAQLETSAQKIWQY
jgi:uncharacterized damage-inducible protein DinB